MGAGGGGYRPIACGTCTGHSCDCSAEISSFGFCESFVFVVASAQLLSNQEIPYQSRSLSRARVAAYPRSPHDALDARSQGLRLAIAQSIVRCNMRAVVS